MVVRLDAHQHFWVYNEHDYAWLAGHRILEQDYLPEHLQPNLIENGFHGSIAVQARQTIDETEFLLGLQQEHPFIRGIIGWVDLQADNLLAVLTRYHGSVCGFRHQVSNETDPGYLTHRDFQRGLTLLGDFGYTCDLLLRPEHLQDCAALADKFPAQPLVINHLAKPAFNEDGFSKWSEQIAELARRANVFCKLSGLITAGDQRPGTQAVVDGFPEEEIYIDAFLPFLEHAHAVFGAERLMFGSDWPTCTIVATYDETYDVIDTYLHSMSRSEQDAIMGNTAATFYGIRVT